MKYEELLRKDIIESLQEACHMASIEGGWWVQNGVDLRDEMNSRSRFGIALGMEKITLIHSEVSEATEGWRKDCMDTHLPHRKMIEVELADALIRIFDFAGALNLDLAGAVVEKMAYNRTRQDHTAAARNAKGGKAC